MQGKTLKQIADELGIPKQQVYRFVKRNHISEAHQRSGVMHYDEAAETLIKRAFSRNSASSEAHHEAHHEAVSDAVVHMLHKELEIKNEQIRELNARLAESNAALVAAQQTAQAAQALHAGSMQKLLEEKKERKPFTFPWKKKKGD